jgi:cbb3-type cytochrome oxidase subunit 3
VGWGGAVQAGASVLTALLVLGALIGIAWWLRRNAVRGARDAAAAAEAADKAEAHEAVAESRRHPGPGPFGGGMRDVAPKPLGSDVAGPPGGGSPPP